MGRSVILGGARTPFGRRGGALSGMTAVELGALAGSAAIERAGVTGAAIEHLSLIHISEPTRPY